jgi:hypothetical protein
MQKIRPQIVPVQKYDSSTDTTDIPVKQNRALELHYKSDPERKKKKMKCLILLRINMAWIRFKTVPG